MRQNRHNKQFCMTLTLFIIMDLSILYILKSLALELSRVLFCLLDISRKDWWFDVK